MRLSKFAYSFSSNLSKVGSLMLDVVTDVFTDAAEMLTLDGASNVNCSLSFFFSLFSFPLSSFLLPSSLFSSRLSPLYFSYCLQVLYRLVQLLFDFH